MRELKNLSSIPALQRACVCVCYKMLSEIPVKVCKQITLTYNNSAAVCMSVASDRLTATEQLG